MAACGVGDKMMTLGNLTVDKRVVLHCARGFVRWMTKGSLRIGRATYARKVDTRLPGKENSDSHGARPVHQIISMMDQ